MAFHITTIYIPIFIPIIYDDIQLEIITHRRLNGCIDLNVNINRSHSKLVILYLVS